MTMFKIKKSKKENPNKQIYNLSQKHTDILNNFNKQINNIPEKEKQILELEKKISSNTISNKELYNYKYQIKCLKNDIEKLKNKDNIYEYYLNTSSQLYKYYSNEIDSSSKASIFNDYMKVISKTNKNKFDGNIDKIVKNNICEKCQKEKCLIEVDTFLICNECANTVEIIINCDKPSFKEIPNDKPQFTYHRMHHFRELLSQVQGKESTIIPQEIYDTLNHEIKKQRKDVSKIKKEDIRNLLKKLGFTKFYEHDSKILHQINPSLSLRFTKNEEEKLIYMFNCIQEPYVIACSNFNRKNFIKYNYIFHKFCEILEIHHAIKDQMHFPLLKSRVKLTMHDKLWKKIIENILLNPDRINDGINWKFIPTV